MKARIMIAGALLSMHLAPISLFSQSSLKGVWKGLEYHYQGNDTAYIWKDIQPCFYLFTERHYSIVYVAGIKAREPLPDGTPRNNISSEQWRAIGTPFVANSGTYEVTDTTFITNPMVAILPRMNYPKNIVNYKIEKDVLWISRKEATGSWKLKLSRLE